MQTHAAIQSDTDRDCREYGDCREYWDWREYWDCREYRDLPIILRLLRIST